MVLLEIPTLAAEFSKILVLHLLAVRKLSAVLITKVNLCAHAQKAAPVILTATRDVYLENVK